MRVDGREGQWTITESRLNRVSAGPILHSGMRVTVWDVLGWLAAIISHYPELEREDFRDVYDYAARVGRRVAL